MPYPHPIRLRGPWQLEPLVRYLLTADGSVESKDSLPPPCRATVPSDWGDLLGGDFRGRVRYRRSFNPPASLDAHERVWLVVEGVDARGSVSLNGAQLGNVRGYAIVASYDITSLIAARNEIVLDVELPVADAASGEPLRPGRETMPGGPVGEVRLEIRAEQFLDRLALWSVGALGHEQPARQQFVAMGHVAGAPTTADLAVVISGGQRELAYIEAPACQNFHLAFEADDFPTWTKDGPRLGPIEVKLLAGGSSIWQRQLQTGFRVAEVDRAALRLKQVLSDGAYTDFDRAGTTVIQCVPLAWADAVCPRLAHHPSIVAWSTGGGDGSPRAPTFGRPWY